jgi:HK97 family phage major capsid protein
MFKASKQILDDFAQLQSMSMRKCAYGLKYVEEQEILFGDGTGAHLHGIVPQASFAAAFAVESRTVLTICARNASGSTCPLPGIRSRSALHDWAKLN